MPSEPEIILYDIPSKLNPQAWSPNTWKARTVLNYKRIPYKTVWVSYPDIKPTLIKLGGKPTGTDAEGNPYYSLPAIQDNSGSTPIVITDSLVIVEYLEAKYPDRPVFPKEGKALQYAFEQAFSRIVASQMFTPLVPSVWKILDDRGQVYFRETRDRWYGNGKKLEEWSPEGPVREGHWEAIRAAWEQLAAILDKNGPGAKYVAGGKEPTFADMIIVSFLAWVKAAAPEDWENRVKHWSGGRWEGIWNASEEWRLVV